MVKFSHAIQMNSSPEWREKYLSYSRLKKITYVLEKAVLGTGGVPSTPGDLDQMAAQMASPFAGPIDTDKELEDDEFDDKKPLLRKTSPGPGPASSSSTGNHHAPIYSPSSNHQVVSPLPYNQNSSDLSQAPSFLPNPRKTLSLSHIHNSPFSIQEANSFFIATLDKELEKIIEFYKEKEAELKQNLNKVIEEISTSERGEQMYLQALSTLDSSPGSFSASRNYPHEASRNSPHQNSPIPAPRDSSPNLQHQPAFLPYLIWSSVSLRKTKTSLTTRLIDIFVLLRDLTDYVDINETGFGKVTKKYEKVIGGKIKKDYLSMVTNSYPFLNTTKTGLKEAVDSCVKWYARIAFEGKTNSALTALQEHLRRHIVWERNTIWRDMVDQERRRETIGFVTPVIDGMRDSSQGAWSFLWNRRILVVLVALSMLAILSNVPIFSTPPQNKCFAILIFASIMWAFEAVPLFITSIMIPLLVVLLNVMTDPITGIPLPAKPAAKKIFSSMFGPVIMLLLGGFSLASALSKHNIAKSLASSLLSKAGTEPKFILLANMGVSTFASMWISNVAAPVLCFSLVGPILRNLPSRSTYGRSLVLGIAMAANVGGMASPIASPQNVISMGIMSPSPSWLQWFTISLPIVIILDLCIWFVLLFYFQIGNEVVLPPEIHTRTIEPFNRKQWGIVFVCILTIVLWCVEGQIEQYVGDMGVIAGVPIILFYATGVLTKDDWNSMLWSVVMLAMGGIALGSAVESSGLLQSLSLSLIPILGSYSPFTCLAFLSLIVVIITSFISHTVGALIILPIIAHIGTLLPDPRPRTLVMAAALLCSGGMALPVSSFPNMNAISLEDSTGVPWLFVSDFLAVGAVSSALAFSLVVSVGYPIMTLMEFG